MEQVSPPREQFAADDPGRCYAIEAGPGDKVLVPPGWAHATISADPNVPLTFGALCDREYGFEYAEVRSHGGLAWYPVVDDGSLHWQQNPAYRFRPLTVRGPRIPLAFTVDPVLPLYRQLQADFDAFAWIANPGLMAEVWSRCEP